MHFTALTLMVHVAAQSGEDTKAADSKEPFSEAEGNGTKSYAYAADGQAVQVFFIRESWAKRSSKCTWTLGFRSK